MSNIRLSQEIIRLAKSRGYTCDNIYVSGRLEVWHNGARLLDVVPESGYEIRYNKDINEFDSLRRKVREFTGAVMEAREYVAAMEKASPLSTDELSDGYKLLLEHNHIVLAGKDMGRYGFEFVTWEWNHDHAGVGQGHYLANYTAAKEDFAFRSGLMPYCKRYMSEQATAMHRIIAMALDRGMPHGTDECRLLEDCRNKLERAYPELTERVAVLVAEREKPAEVRMIRNSMYSVQDIVGESLVTPCGSEEVKFFCGEPDEESAVSRILPDFEVTGPIVIAAYDNKTGQLKSLTPEQIDEQKIMIDDPSRLPEATVIVCDPNAEPKLTSITPSLEGIQGLLNSVSGIGEFGSIGRGRIKAFFSADVDTGDLITNAHVCGMPDGIVAAMGRIVVAATDDTTGSVYSMTWDERYDCMRSLRASITLTPEQLRRELESFHAIEPPARENGPSMSGM